MTHNTLPPMSIASGAGDNRVGILGGPDLRMLRRLLIATSAVGSLGFVTSSIPFIESMEPSARARAEGEPTDVDINELRVGELATVIWRGKPVWLLKRDSRMQASLQNDRVLLADPDSQQSAQPNGCRNAFRSLQPDLAVILGVCTHLGCLPQMRDVNAAGADSLGKNWPGGFLCPCHGSKFDFAGRVFKNVPAPINLEIPPYSYRSPSTIRIGSEFDV